MVASFASAGFAQTCGVASLFDLCQLAGRDLSKDQRQELVEGYPAEESSMLQIKQAADKLTLPLLGVAASLDELTNDVPGPKIIHLTDPAHFAVMARGSEEWVQLLDGGRVVVVARKEIEKRYSGHALILEQEEKEGGPRLEVEEFHHTFGIAGVGQEVEHAFKVSNVGDQDLLVHPASCSSCGAPEVAVAKEDLAPGQSTQVTVKFTITYSGSVMKSAKLLTTDPAQPVVFLTAQPVVFLTVHGKVPHDLRVYPDRLYLGGDKGELPSRTLTVSGPAEMDQGEVSTERGLFDIHLGEPQVSEDEKKTWQLELTLKPENFVGEIADQLSIRTTHAERPLITIPITGRIRGDLKLTPPTVFFGFVKPGEKAEQTVTIESRSLAAFTLKDLTPDSPKLRAGTPEQREGRWVIAISADTSEPGVVEGKLTVTTDVPGEETLAIPVYAHIVAAQQ
jgi:hypothetical protein